VSDARVRSARNGAVSLNSLIVDLPDPILG